MTYTIVSFSGGKDSTAMLLHMIELGEHIDEVLNIDTGMEYPAMYDHIDKVREIVDDAGIPFVKLKNAHSFEWWMLEHPVKSKQYGDHIGYGWPSMNCRWCTRHMKMDLIRAHLKEIKTEHEDWTQCIGLAADEVKRLSRGNNMNKHHRHPLVEWGWSERDALQYCKSRGFDWGGLYDIFNRVSCWCCPLAATSELRSLWKNFPELWSQLEEWERILSDPKRGCKFMFKDDTSVFDLRARFELEEPRIKRGLSIDTPGFYQNLRRLGDLPEGQTKLELDG